MTSGERRLFKRCLAACAIVTFKMQNVPEESVSLAGVAEGSFGGVAFAAGLSLDQADQLLRVMLTMLEEELEAGMIDQADFLDLIERTDRIQIKTAEA